MKFSHLFGAVLGFIVFNVSSAADDPLAATYEAHGGLQNWRSQGTMMYDLHLTYGESVASDHQEIDLVNRNVVASNSDYGVGFDGQNLWLDQSGETGPLFPPRFYLWTPFYFLGAPFVFADDGVVKTELPPAEFEDQEFRVVRVTFESGVGDASDDVYHLYIDPETNRLRMMRYTVSYFPSAAGKPTDALPESAILYQRWNETAAGITLANKTISYAWVDDHISGEPRAKMNFSNLRFLQPRPTPARFAAPPTATLVE
tara:strand:+ start:619 stop:1392 length:774 start_codon:yes stop_codon:yes gene_type:complete